MEKIYSAVCSIVKTCIFVGVYTDAKELLKRLAFSLKSETKFPSANNGGIGGIFLLHNK